MKTLSPEDLCLAVFFLAFFLQIWVRSGLDLVFKTPFLGFEGINSNLLLLFLDASVFTALFWAVQSQQQPWPLSVVQALIYEGVITAAAWKTAQRRQTQQPLPQ